MRAVRRFTVFLLTVWMALAAVVLPVHSAWVESHAFSHVQEAGNGDSHEHAHAHDDADERSASAEASCLDDCCAHVNCAHAFSTGVVGSLASTLPPVASQRIGAMADTRKGTPRPSAIERPKWAAATPAVAAI